MGLQLKASRWVALALTSLTAMATVLVGCGGSADDASQDGSASAFGISATPSLTGPLDNRRYLICGQEVAPNYLSGKVLSVHDGDTIVISANPAALTIRLEGIDAPELAQPFGVESRDSLKESLLGKTVIIAHKINDQYGRVLGSVFTQECLYANLDQLSKGLAWFYRAYQCELNLSQRTLFGEAETKAAQARLGLWSQTNPVPPWYFRNGTNPAIPTCTSDWPKWPSNVGMPGDGLAISTGGSTGGSTSGGGTSSGGTSSGLTVVCGVKKTCSVMNSCSEAKAYYSQCSLTSLDGDGDGIPCEALCKP